MRGVAHETDLELARRCASDAASQAELYKRYSLQAYRLAMRLVSRPSDAEDVVQDSFIQVFGSLANYRGEASLKTWIDRIVVRRAWKLLERRKRRQPQAIVRDADEQDSGLPAADRVAAFRTALARLQLLLQQIAPKRRVVFLLHEIEGYPLGETAQLLGISLTAAKSRSARARRDLQRLARQDDVLRSLIAEVQR